MKKKILLALLVVIILLGIGGAYAYFATDAFKSDKEMFFSYISSDICSNLKDEKLEEYIKKQETTAYTNKGDVSINVSGDNSLTSTVNGALQTLKDGKITLEGKTDNSRKMAEQTMTVELEQGINVPIKIKRDEDVLGIQSNLLNTKFIAVRNQNLKALLEKFGINSDEIPDKIDFNEGQLTQEEIDNLKNKCISILHDNLDDTSFSKEKVDGQTVIKLNTSNKHCQEILVKILETLRDDEIVLKKMSGTLSEKDFKQRINTEIDKIKDTEVDDNSMLEIKLYIKTRKVKKVEMSIDGNNESKIFVKLENSDRQMLINVYENDNLVGDLSVLKQASGDDLTYTVNASLTSEGEESVSLDFKIQYKNIATLDDVEENYEINVSSVDSSSKKVNLSLDYKNLKSFATDIEIEEINSNNSIILNDATDDELDDLLMTIYSNLGLY